MDALEVVSEIKNTLKLSLTFSFIIESWLILSPLASGTSSTPINLALYRTPLPLNLASRNSSVFSGLAAAEKYRDNKKKGYQGRTQKYLNILLLIPFQIYCNYLEDFMTSNHMEIL